MSDNEICNTRLGKIEYCLEGEGTVVLFVHGGHGSCRSDFRQQHLLDNGFSVLIPSRPGYAGTPIESGKSAAATAHLFGALCESLGIKEVFVVGVSAGGPTALEFARLYPGLVKKLVLESAVVKPWFHKLTFEYYGSKIIFHPKRQKRFWVNLCKKLEEDERKTLLGNIKLFSKLNPAEVLQRLNDEEIEVLKTGSVTANDSGSGFFHDVEHRASHIEDITCPVLIIHSRNDGSVPFSHAEYARDHIKNSQLFSAPTDSHFIYIGPGSQEVLQKRLAFLLADCAIAVHA